MEPDARSTVPRMRWRVGDLARATGLTVRTLHHYEAIGLLERPARTESGHRLYTEASIRRLYRIRVLRNLGVPLAGIRQVIDDGRSLTSVLHDHLARVEEQVDSLTRLRDGLRRMCGRIGTAGVDADDLLRTIEAMSRLERHVHTQRATSPPASSVEPQWRKLGEELRACLDAGADPSSPRVRAIAGRAKALIHDFSGGDAAIVDALAHLRTAAPPVELAGWDPPLMAYLDRALRALDTEETGHAE